MYIFNRFRYIFFIILLSLLLIFISSCKQQENFNLVNQNQPESAATDTPTPTTESTLDATEEPLAYDPLSEEDTGIPVDENENLGSDTNEDTNVEDTTLFGTTILDTNIDSDSTTIKYAGATPIPILPIDIPTPTPQQALQFTYQEYQATKLNLKFEAPVGWEVDDTQQDAYVLTEPLTNQKDGFSAEIIIRAIPLSKEYSSSDLNREIKSQLEQMGLLNYTSWSPSLVAKRDLLGKSGLYANYRGTLVNGIRIRGRLQMVAIGTTLYSVQITGPSKYNTDFTGVHTHIRRTLAFINATTTTE